MSRSSRSVEKRVPIGRALLGVGIISMLVFVVAENARSQGPRLEEWAVEPGASLQIDSSGFDLPTGIAFVADPGSGPQDPLYFVTELEGVIKVVTNDRSVHIFANVETRELPRRDLRAAGQTGLAGICLDSARGSVFVTYTYPDGGILRNGITRFDTGEPWMFGLYPTRESTFNEVFAHAQSAPSHQIGHCVVDDERVFVGVGDGGNPAAANDVDVLLGKIVCLTIDGDPCPDNPFLERGAIPTPRDYVYAYGFRNPFGLALADGVLFAAENGISTDRLLRILAGEDHFWDGSDDSMAVGADFLFTEARSPVQLDYVSEDLPGLPPVGTFVFSVFAPSPYPGVMALEYDFENMRTSAVPRFLLQYTGERDQTVIATAVGPDGVYAASALPDEDGASHVFRVAYDPSAEHSHVIGVPDEGSPLRVLMAHSCISCHAIEGEGGDIGPSLDGFGMRWRLTQRLNSAEYVDQVARVDQLETEPFVSFRDARQEVLVAEGTERTRVWLKHFLTEPRFDNPDTLMPNLNLSGSAIAELTDTLSRPLGGGDRTLFERFTSLVMSNRREVGVGYVLGALSVIGLAGVWQLARLTRRRRGGKTQ